MSDRSPLRAWLELLRAPNLLTVPGDPLAGFLLASKAGASADLTRAIPCAAAAVLLYAGGLISNDVFDLEEDRRDRPHRPLPSGRISKRAATAATAALFALGIGAAAISGAVPAMIAGVITALVVVYCAGAKRVPVLGPLVMGLCRGASLMLGASALGVEAMRLPVPILAAGGLTLYVAAVTAVAAREMSGSSPGWKALAPCVVMLVWLPFISHLGPGAATPPFAVIAQGLGLMTALFIGTRGIDIQRQSDPRLIARGIGTFIRALLPAQASLAVAGAVPGVYVAAALLVLWPVSAIVGRRFYSS